MTTLAITTQQLITIAAEGETKGFNRQLSPSGVRQCADPRGLHVLVFDMMHEHKGGVECEPHKRCQFWVKMINENEPVSVTVDMTIDLFNELSADAIKSVAVNVS